MQIDMTRFEEDGFAITEAILSPSEVAKLVALIEENVSSDSKRGGIRDIMSRVPELQATAEHAAVRAIVDQALGENAFVVRSTLFDKTDSANWKVPWHQDVTIAVSERADTGGFGPWSVKEGVTHVQPTTAVLNRMVTVRVHLDACPASNGALRVMPGSHRLGRIDQNDAPEHVDEAAAVACEVEAGAALVMRPLLLHASSPSVQPTHRRVLHFDFAEGELPNGLQWRLR
jgi:ectoine hydroxylase-related dioxygenase (phytanoyl-CoA dioxygenase family)